jgi:hypothetical protein
MMKMNTKMKTTTMTASWLIVVIILVIGSGCIDSRIKRAASLVNTKTTIESKEFSDAKTTEEKLRIAENHFKTLPPLTQVLDDYMQGKKPVDQGSGK